MSNALHNLSERPCEAPPLLHRPTRAPLEFLWLELTNQCNLKCVHCYAGSSPHEPKSHGFVHADWLRVLSEARDLGCKSVQFIGGEPFLYRQLWDLVAHARAVGYSFIEIYTNGTRISKNDIVLAKEHAVHLAFSCYSDQDEHHDKVTQVGGSFKRTIASIQRTVAAEIPTRVGVISMKENQDSASKAVALLKAMGVQRVKIDGIRGPRRDETPAPDFDPYSQLCGNCWRGNLAINSAGEIAPCVMSRFATVGNVRNGIAAALDSEELGLFRQKVRQIEEDLRQGTIYSCNPDPCNPNCSPGGTTKPCNPNCNPGDWTPPCSPSTDCSPTEPSPSCQPCCQRG